MEDENFLDQESFTESISNLPLVSIDLIVGNAEGDYLLGLRTNRPAKGNWFVPGGRIRRMELLSDAFSRIVDSELGCEVDINEASFHGVFEHMYSDSAFSSLIGSHYISIAFSLILDDLNIETLPNFQHIDYRWFPVEEILSAASVNIRTKEFFDMEIGVRK